MSASTKFDRTGTGAPKRPRRPIRALRATRRAPACLLATFALGFTGTVLAQALPNGPEFQVNSYTTGSQILPDVAATPDGGAVVVWGSQGSTGSDTSSYSVQARLYDRSGLARSSEFQVNSYTTASQWRPVVAPQPGGGFVVVWSSFGSSGTDTSESSIQAQRYSPSGIRLGDQFQVNTYTEGNQNFPAVATDAEGNFVVAWSSRYASPGPDQYWSIQARRYSSEGLPIGGQFQVNTYGYSWQYQPAAAREADGDFVIVWSSVVSPGDDNWSVRARRYDNSGIPLGDEFQVNSYATGAQYNASVAATDDGDFLVVWSSSQSDGTDSSQFSVRGRRFASGGIPLGDDFQVNSYTTGDQELPDVAVDPDGGFVVLWESEGSYGSDASGRSVQGRRFAPDGTPLTDEFQVNTFSGGDQRFTRVAVDRDGNWLAAWNSDGSYGSDTSAESIQTRRYDALFRDGFEGGGTARWSATQP